MYPAVFIENITDRVASKNPANKAPESPIKILAGLKKGDELPLNAFEIKEGETQPPKRYNSGSMILAMENAGQFIEDEDLLLAAAGRDVRLCK